MLGSFPYCKPAMFLCPWGFSRQEYWSGLPCPLPGDLPNPGLPHFRYFLSSLEIFDVSTWILVFKCFPGGAEVKASGCNVGDLDSIPGSGRSHGEGNGNPLQSSCLENPMDRGAWWTTVHGLQRVGHDWATSPSPRIIWASLVAQLVKNPPAMWETWVRSLGWEDLLEKGKATHSSILAWRIPWAIQSMGLQRVKHDWLSLSVSLLGSFTVIVEKQYEIYPLTFFSFSFFGFIEIKFYTVKFVNFKSVYDWRVLTNAWNHVITIKLQIQNFLSPP